MDERDPSQGNEPRVSARAASRAQRAEPTRCAHAFPTLVLGLGNILLRDEGVGVRVIEAMQGLPLPAEVEVLDGGTAGFDLIELLAGRRKVVVIDAIDADCLPGTVIELTPDDLVPPSQPGSSLHEAGLLEALAAAKQLGVLPDEVVIIGVKPKEVEWGLDLSPDIEGLIPRIVKAVMAKLEGSCRCQTDGVAERNEHGKN